MKSRIISFVVVIAFVVLSSCAKPEQPLTAAEFIELGEKYLLEQNYEQALVQFLKVIEVEPMSPRGYTGAAEAYVGLDRTEDAIEVLKKGLELLPDNADMQTRIQGFEASSESNPDPNQTTPPESSDVDIQSDYSSNAFERVMDEVARNSELVQCTEVTFFGERVDKVLMSSIYTVRDTLEINGYADGLGGQPTVEEHEEFLWLDGTIHSVGGPEIVVSQKYSEEHISYLWYNDYQITQGSLEIGIMDMTTDESLISFLTKFGFANPEIITEHISSRYGKIVGANDVSEYLLWVGFMDNYQVYIDAGGGGIVLDDETKQINSCARIVLTPQNSDISMQFDFNFEDNIMQSFTISHIE